MKMDANHTEIISVLKTFVRQVPQNLITYGVVFVVVALIYDSAAFVLFVLFVLFVAGVVVSA